MKTRILVILLFGFLFSVDTNAQLSPVEDTTVCNQYLLPTIAGTNLSNPAYFFQPNGQGARLNPGDLITTSSIVFIQATVNGQIEEECFIVNIIENEPELDGIPDIIACEEYYLPIPKGQYLTPLAGYYTSPNGQGPFYAPGTRINRSLTLYAYDGIPGCESEQVFQVNIVGRPQFYPYNDTMSCESFFLPAIRGFNIPNGAHYRDFNTGEIYEPESYVFRSSLFEVVMDTADCIIRDTFQVYTNREWRFASIPDVKFCDTARISLKKYLLENSFHYLSPNAYYLRNGSTSKTLIDDFIGLGRTGTYYIIDSISPTCIIEEVFRIDSDRSFSGIYYNETINACRNQIYDLKSFGQSRNFRGKNYRFENNQGNIITDDLLDTVKFKAGKHCLKIIVDDPFACDIKSDTSSFCVMLYDDCEVRDSLILTSCYISLSSGLANSLMYGGNVYDKNFDFISIINSFTGQNDPPGEHIYYYTVSSPSGKIDTAIIKYIVKDSTLTYIGDSFTLCREECRVIQIKTLAPQDTLFAFMNLFVDRQIDSLFYETAMINQVNICYKEFPNTENYNFSDTIYIDRPNTDFYYTYSPRNTNIISGFGSVNDSCYSLPRDTVFITTLEDTRFLFEATICPESSVEFEGQTFDASRPSGKIISQVPAHNGCDSTIEVRLDFYELPDTTIQFVFCEPDTVYYNCTAFHPGYTFEQQILSGASQFGCDSIVNISVLFFESDSAIIDTLICADETLSLFGQKYDEPGTYYDTLRNRYGCDQTYYTIFIEETTPTIDSLYSTMSCQTDNTISVTGNFDFVRWSTGQISNSIITDTSGWFFVSVSDNIGCQVTDSLFLEAPEAPPVISGDSLYIVKLGRPVQPRLNISGDYLGIEWSNPTLLNCNTCLNPVIFTDEETTLWMTVYYADSCTVEYPIQIILETEYYLPNIIHPDSDQPLNQRLFLQGSSDEVVYEIRVFDRWGTTIFVADEILINDLNSGWDGTFNGEVISQGIYVYSIKYLDQRTGATGLLSGDVLVVR